MLKPFIEEKLYPHRFDYFFLSQVAILFGSLVIPVEIFEDKVFPFVLLLNLLCGILVISKKTFLAKLFFVLFLITFVTQGLTTSRTISDFVEVDYARLGMYFIFHIVVAFQIIRQIWLIDEVNQKVIIGLISGYISIGLLGFFMFLIIELISPGSYGGLGITEIEPGKTMDSILYYSYITLLTIGYGEIYPISSVAQKASILLGLMGQFYLVIITAVVIEKYIRYRAR